MARQTRPAWSKGFGVFLIPGMICLSVIILIPFLMNVATSFTRWTGVGIPIWKGLANYIRAAGDPVFWASFRNNLLMIFAVTIIPTIVGLLLAVAVTIYAADVDTRSEYLRVVSDFEAGTELVAKADIMSRYDFAESVAIGDGLTDVNIALRASVVFARGHLERYLEGQGKSYQAWKDFFDIRDDLAQRWPLSADADG